jgi:GrpB-like predicted nucleotidyltransferase (UPF0157 family)
MTSPAWNPHDPNADPAIPVNTPTAVNGQVVIVDYDPAWPAMYTREAGRIRAALGDLARRVEHIGSTAVPGLPAKPCIDILLVVKDSAEEPAYVPDLVAAGYVLRIRAPEWDEHRIFKGSEINLNLHVWGEGSSEIDRHLAFRDWLRAQDDDRERYAAAKRELGARHWVHMQDYAEAKNAIVNEIQERMSTNEDTHR